MSFLQLRYFNRDIPMSKKQRRAIYGDARKLWWKRRRNVALYCVAVVAGFFVVNVASDTVQCLLSGTPPKLLGIIDVSLMAAYGVVIGVVLERYCYGPLVRQVMRSHGFDICLKCGYWLRGLPDDSRRCPECGETTPPKETEDHDAESQ